MSMSGIEVDPEITTLFNDIKIRHTNKWATFKIENKKKVVLEKKGEAQETTDFDSDRACFQELLDALTDDPRYILYDFGFTNKEGRKIQKLAFIFWCDDNKARIGDKMIYASTKDSIKKIFTGISLEFQANDRGDMDYDSFSAEVDKKA